MIRIYTKRDSDEIRKIFYKKQREIDPKDKMKRIVTKEEMGRLKKIGRPTENCITLEDFKKRVREITQKENEERRLKEAVGFISASELKKKHGPKKT